MPSKQKDPRVTKRRVTMRSATLLPNGQTATAEAVDFVPPEILDAYVADAKSRWQFVEVSKEPDAGPAGYDGDTRVPPHLEGRRASDFVRYQADPNPDVNALDEQLRAEGAYSGWDGSRYI